MKLKKEIEEIQQTLAQERDILRVKAHLFKAEMLDEWNIVEKKWDRFKFKAEGVLKVGQESAEDVQEAVKLLGGEIGTAYKKLMKKL